MQSRSPCVALRHLVIFPGVVRFVLVVAGLIDDLTLDRVFFRERRSAESETNAATMNPANILRISSSFKNEKTLCLYPFRTGVSTPACILSWPQPYLAICGVGTANCASSS